MKVAFIGSHGVGKTTLCFELAAGLKHAGLNVDVVKEVARLSPLPINRRTSVDAQTWILMMQIAEEIRSASVHDVVICDRSVLDNYAYMALAAGRQPVVERFVDHWLQTYDLLFKVPVTGRADPDGVRDVDERFVHQIDALVDTLLLEKQLRHERLDPGSRERWSSHARDLVLARRKASASVAREGP
jgi:nicotinamide riboside kinase